MEKKIYQIQNFIFSKNAIGAKCDRISLRADTHFDADVIPRRRTGIKLWITFLTL